MAVFRVERNRGYTVMSNHHLRNKELSLKAKGLLSQMLSLPEDWDYTLAGLSLINKESIDAIRTAIWELEKAGYITRRQGRDERGKMTAIEYTIYEQPQHPDPPAPPDAPGLDMPHPENPYVAGPDMAGPHPEMAAELNINTSSTKKENTKRCSDLSVRPSTEVPVEGQTDVTDRRAQIMAQIEYDHIVTPANREQIDEFVELMLEVALTRSPTIHIGRDQEYPAALVQQRFAMLERTHIEKVLDGISENTTRVRNARAYLLAALFNAPASTGNYYTMLVNHDLYGG